MYKNVASQKIAIYAHDTAADAPKTGDAANITAQISKDGGACAATNDANPSELDATNAKGIYLFDITQDESNANLIVLSAISSTSDVQIEAVIIYTSPILEGQIERVLGLMQENQYMDNTVYIGDNMTSCRIRIYSVPGSVGTDNDIVATYNVTCSYVGDNIETFKVVKQ